MNAPVDLPPLRFRQERQPFGKPIPGEKGSPQAEFLSVDDPAQFSNATSELHYNNGTVQIDINNIGIQLVSLGSGNYIYLRYDSFIEILRGATGNVLDINPTLLTQDMGIKEIDVCSGGVAKKMLVIASDPY